MDKKNVDNAYSGVLFSLKKGRKFVHATTWTNLEDSMPSEASQSQEDESCMSPLVRNLEKLNSSRRKVESDCQGQEQRGAGLELFSGCEVPILHGKKSPGDWLHNSVNALT